MQRQRLKFLTSVGVAQEPLRTLQQQQERERKRDNLKVLLAEDCIDLAAIRTAILDGALYPGPDRETGWEDSPGENGAGGADTERDTEAGEAAINKMRSVCWQLLLTALPVHRKSWPFYARQQQEWYADLHKAAAALIRAAPWGGGLRSPLASTANLRFTFCTATLGRNFSQAHFVAAARLMDTLDLKQLVSPPPAHMPSHISPLDAALAAESCPTLDHTGINKSGDAQALVGMRMSLKSAILPSADVDEFLRLNGHALIESEAERGELRADAFDLPALAVVFLMAIKGEDSAGPERGGRGESGKAGGTGGESEAFWCLLQFVQQSATTGAVFELVHSLEVHLLAHDPQLVEHLEARSLSVADIARAWMRSLFAGTLVSLPFLTLSQSVPALTSPPRSPPNPHHPSPTFPTPLPSLPPSSPATAPTPAIVGHVLVSRPLIRCRCRRRRPPRSAGAAARGKGYGAGARVDLRRPCSRAPPDFGSRWSVAPGVGPREVEMESFLGGRGGESTSARALWGLVDVIAPIKQSALVSADQ
jgi:hypothetical protein